MLANENSISNSQKLQPEAKWIDEQHLISLETLNSDKWTLNISSAELCVVILNFHPAGFFTVFLSLSNS